LTENWVFSKRSEAARQSSKTAEVRSMRALFDNLLVKLLEKKL
jgi:hypothetical protein